jgi:hypothetical protein
VARDRAALAKAYALQMAEPSEAIQYTLMKDMQAHLEKLQLDAEECALISKLASCSHGSPIIWESWRPRWKARSRR